MRGSDGCFIWRCDMNTEKAYLSNNGDMIKFQYGKWTVRFRGPYSLEYFTAIKDWDNGHMRFSMQDIG